jgi:hypothetical protein
MHGQRHIIRPCYGPVEIDENDTFRQSDNDLLELRLVGGLAGDAVGHGPPVRMPENLFLRG